MIHFVQVSEEKKTVNKQNRTIVAIDKKNKKHIDAYRFHKIIKIG